MTTTPESEDLGGLIQGPYGPLVDDHPMVGSTCPVCAELIQAGQQVCLVAVGPAGPEDAARAERGEPFNAQAVGVHPGCVDMLRDAVLDEEQAS